MAISKNVFSFLSMKGFSNYAQAIPDWVIKAFDSYEKAFEWVIETN